MQFEEHPKYTRIIEYGEYGRKLYVVLEGEVMILTPKQQTIALAQNINQQKLSVGQARQYLQNQQKTKAGNIAYNEKIASKIEQHKLEEYIK